MSPAGGGFTLSCIVDHRLVGDGNEVLVAGMGEGPKPRSTSARRDECPHSPAPLRPGPQLFVGHLRSFSTRFLDAPLLRFAQSFESMPRFTVSPVPRFSECSVLDTSLSDAPVPHFSDSLLR